MKTIVYVDGLNLYYSMLRGTPFKWLDLYTLFRDQVLDANSDLDLISDAWRRRFSQAVVCSNDSDLAGALAAIRRDHPNVVLGLVAPVPEQHLVSRKLRDLATWYKKLDTTHLARAQLPDRIPGTRLTRPPEWSGAAANFDSIREPILLPPSAA